MASSRIPIGGRECVEWVLAQGENDLSSQSRPLKKRPVSPSLRKLEVDDNGSFLVNDRVNFPFSARPLAGV